MAEAQNCTVHFSICQRAVQTAKRDGKISLNAKATKLVSLEEMLREMAHKVRFKQSSESNLPFHSDSQSERIRD